RQGGVDDAVRAEVLLQAVGDPEDPAEGADVLAHEQHLGVLLERAAQPQVDGLGQREPFGHRVTPSTGAPASAAAPGAPTSAVTSVNEASYCSNQARSA